MGYENAIALREGLNDEIREGFNTGAFPSEKEARLPRFAFRLFLFSPFSAFSPPFGHLFLPTSHKNMGASSEKVKEIHQQHQQI